MKARNMISVNITKTALEHRDAMRIMPDKSVLMKENFEPTREKVLTAAETPFPEGRVWNTLEKETFNGFDVYSLSDNSYDRIIYYLHGGAWVFDILKEHVDFCDELVNRLDAKVYIPKYPLAPKYSYKETYEMLLAYYDELLKQEKPIYIMGDSAGGQLTLEITRFIKESGRKMPEGIIPLSPCADMTFEAPESVETEDRDPMLAIYGCREFAKMWAKDKTLDDPDLTILNCDLTGFPRTLLFASSDDILGPDNFVLAEKLEKSGVDVLLVWGIGLWHVFPISATPERKRSLDIIQTFCRE